MSRPIRYTCVAGWASAASGVSERPRARVKEKGKGTAQHGRLLRAWTCEGILRATCLGRKSNLQMKPSQSVDTIRGHIRLH
jgi:hypothetical protein